MYGTHKRRNWRESKKESKQEQHYEVGWRLVEKMFYYYNKIKKAVAETRAEQSYIQGGKTGGGSSTHAFISDPTANNGIRLATKLNVVIIDADTLSEDTIHRPEDWIEIIERTLDHFSYEEDIIRVLKDRFFYNKSMYRTCDEINEEKNKLYGTVDAIYMNKDKYYRAKDLGIRYARDCAIQLGLIKIF